jgi:hypothetical protein
LIQVRARTSTGPAIKFSQAGVEVVDMTTTARIFRTVGLATAVAVIGGSALGAVGASAAIALPTTTTVLSSLNPSVVGDPVTFTATVTKTLGIPLGTVQFFDGATPLDALPISLSSGSAQLVTSTLTAGTHDITAQFVPDPLDLTSLLSDSGVLQQVVNTATGGGGGGGGGGGICLPGQQTPKPTISAPARVVGPHAVTVQGTAEANDTVDLYQQATGSPAAKVGSTVANASGTYSFTRNISKQTAFEVQATGACGPATSTAAVTKVALAVALTVTSPKKGRLRMHALTSPRVANQMARFYRVKKDGTRTLLAKVATGAKGGAQKTVKAKSGKRYRVIVKVSAPTGNLPGTSHVRGVRVK